MALAEVKISIVPNNTPSDRVTLDVAGTLLTLPASDVLALILERARRPAQVAGTLLSTVPEIGQRWERYGGIYAGVARARSDVDWANGVAFPNVDYHLIALDEHEDEIPWKDAMAWAQRFEDQADPHAGLPLRSEQALMFANVPELFQKTWYWSREQYAGNAEYAWCQTFSYGYQDDYHKSAQLRARAVRRVPIQ